MTLGVTRLLPNRAEDPGTLGRRPGQASFGRVAERVVWRFVHVGYRTPFLHCEPGCDVRDLLIGETERRVAVMAIDHVILDKLGRCVLDVGPNAACSVRPMAGGAVVGVEDPTGRSIAPAVAAWIRVAARIVALIRPVAGRLGGYAARTISGAARPRRRRLFARIRVTACSVTLVGSRARRLDGHAARTIRCATSTRCNTLACSRIAFESRIASDTFAEIPLVGAPR